MHVTISKQIFNVCLRFSKSPLFLEAIQYVGILMCALRTQRSCFFLNDKGISCLAN